MKKKQPTNILSAFKFITGLSLFSFLFWVCNAQDKKKAESEASSPVQFKLNCVTISKDQLQEWVDKGWTNPADPIKRIFLQFASTDAANIDSVRLTAYPAKGYLEVITEGRKFATIDTGCKQFAPKDTAYYGNNYLQINKLGILDAAGKLKDFSFIRLIPTINKPKFGNYIVFNVEIVKVIEGKATVLSTYSSDPCPHYCPEETEPDNEE